MEHSFGETCVIITAAGRGTRAGGDRPKQWQMLDGKPVLSHTVAAFAGLPIILVISPQDREIAQALFPNLPLIEGGESRAQSVRHALEHLENKNVKKVLIHDGARPLISKKLIQKMIDSLNENVAAAPALSVTDALWRGDEGKVQSLQPREGLYRAQTPQAFHLAEILAAHRNGPSDAPDDVSLALHHGLDVAIIQGEEDNIKLTFSEDFQRAEQIVKGRSMQMRIGNGYDVHAFHPGDHVWLCGVKVPHTKALLGHSDADVGMHALTDAIYGALAQGDIGRHFPPSDPQWKGAESHIFLNHAITLARSLGYELGNCDVTLICERPKIGPRAIEMQAELARIMDVDPSLVSVKATTSEQLGFTGREEGIAAQATVLMVKK